MAFPGRHHCRPIGSREPVPGCLSDKSRTKREAAAPPGIELIQGDGVLPESPDWVSVMA